MELQNLNFVTEIEFSETGTFFLIDKMLKIVQDLDIAVWQNVSRLN